ncbi:MAG: RNA-binding protein [Candidatus Eisenbacteria bacterium]|uniref:RNA-binding protein n=1 Tax=Eiseniibacteriota bacterium TaxID=2212470 RepID=A0A956M414_UNCEI|nr:RNA-binding protein [Candidatus Eisenbacteria bacterium]
MRLDLVLNHLCVFKTRSQAGKACDGGRVWVNGEAARASRPVHVGDVIRFRDSLARFEEEIEVLEVPSGPVPKSRAREMFRVLERRRIENPWDE